MKIYNRYVLTVAVLLFVTTVVLIATGQKSLEVYYTIYIIEALLVTELYTHFNNQARRGLNRVSIMLLAGFVIALAFQVLKLMA